MKYVRMQVTESNSRPGMLSLRTVMPDGQLRGPQHGVTGQFESGEQVVVLRKLDLQFVVSAFQGTYGKSIAHQKLIAELEQVAGVPLT